MFNLIITIISIALIVGLAAASAFYGGDMFTKGAAKSKAATVVSQAQQLQAAAVLYTNDNAGTADLTTIANLVSGGYLKTLSPAGYDATNKAWDETWADDLSGGSTNITVSQDVCNELMNAPAAVGSCASNVFTTANL